ncbi:oxidoreductase [Paraburkholderia sp. B3]|uniref:oxidoreductase n=1 Tax=Paraburkholderia sp. B3 TaxID=3134791 RepID=UPI003981DE4D
MASAQKPLGSGFGPASTADDVLRGINLAGKTAIVTGGYSGIGLPTAEALATAGATVIVPARDIGKAMAALRHVSGVSVEPMDLQDPASIDAFAKRVLSRNSAVHILVNSAGIMANPLTRDSRGYESQFSTNHLGHYQLACRLWPALVKAQGARVVAVSSQGHHFSSVDLNDPNFEHLKYDPWVAYGQSKTANVLFAVELDRRGAHQGVRAFAVHPGRILTDIARFMSAEEIIASGIADAEGNAIVDPAQGMKNPQQGAATSVWCATSPQLDGMGGLYCEDCDVAEPRVGHPIVAGVNPWAIDHDTARKLWALSEQLTAVSLEDAENNL